MWLFLCGLFLYDSATLRESVFRRLARLVSSKSR